ncbi:MAG: DUF2764 family protein [Verrucomicrobia bacterium]|jgi:hypothetical protein|nr:DUF2764 family protein [Verrucomicrobiota bacterium]
MSYYYLVSSLPSITLDASPELSSEAFQALCAEHLTASDARALGSISDAETGHESSHPFAGQWIARETQLRNAAARLRAAKRQQDAGSFLRDHTGFDVGLEDGVEEAFNQSTPLARERALDEIRWRILDELAGTDPFGGGAVLAYGVKLRLAERWAQMDAASGQAKIEAAIAPSEGTSPQGETIETETAE